MAKTPAWQRKEGKDPKGGLNRKGVESYRKANPGSKLQTAVTTKPSKLIEAINLETGNTEFVPESVIRAELEEAKKDDEFRPKYVAQKEVTDIEEVYNTKTNRFEFVSREALEKSYTKDKLNKQKK